MERQQQRVLESSPNSSTKGPASSSRLSGQSEAPAQKGTANLEERLKRGEFRSFNGQLGYATPILPKATTQVGRISGPAGSSIAKFSATTSGLIGQLAYNDEDSASHFSKSGLISTNRPSMNPNPTIYSEPGLHVSIFIKKVKLSIETVSD